MAKQLSSKAASTLRRSSQGRVRSFIPHVSSYGTVGYFRITLAVPVLLALSATRITTRCSPADRLLKSRTNFSLGESITPSTDSTGTQLAASREYSQRRSEYSLD